MQCATLTSDTIYFERIKLFFSMFACAGEIRSSLNFPVKQIAYSLNECGGDHWVLSELGLSAPG